ncbi:exodeoxyribonuclease VII small subunit [Nitrosomonas halophila]|uniref:Exodeoxyribonuclease 7 small subunit n=1 Tax=Nitrosomonas halophila TaxID=44576 RepID=A0A1H3I890_9PROT|nr:exodeoxyribonuclease VII small subunit [Nitrosomonas halophila]SDY23897.1 exodeoxyribonuclease VII small subunit [Nitrosomonas halophila]
MKKKSPDHAAVAADSARPASFEAASAELENIVAAMEAGQMSLEDSLSAYKRGVELLQYCQATLKDSQQQIKILEADMLKNFSTVEHDEH